MPYGTSSYTGSMILGTPEISSDPMTLPVWITSSRPVNVVNGTIGYNSQTANVEIFANGAWITIASGNLGLDFTIVAGGGGGGAAGWGGGGGAGGFATGSTTLTNVNTITVTVGAGGAGSTTNVPGYPGSDSVILLSATNTDFTALGGGGGGSWQPSTAYPTTTFPHLGISGGSGGGCNSKGSTAAIALQPRARLPGLGNSGGTGSSNNSTYDGGGGGGGAGAVGANGGNNFGGAGGIGTFNAMTNATLAGQLSSGNYYVCGGGGAGSTGTGGSGGIGGGGAGASSSGSTATAATANTGGGGGGSNGSGSAGGSGVVIIRYLATYGLPSAVIGSPLLYTPGDGYFYYKFNSSGTLIL